MKSTGMVRQLDKLGRIVIPKEIRHVFHIENEDSLEIYVENNKIILEKYAPSCIFCGSSDHLSAYCGKNVCADCIKKLQLASEEKDAEA